MSKNASKIKCYRCDELEHYIRDWPQLKDQMKATRMVADCSNSDGYNDALIVSDEISPFQL